MWACDPTLTSTVVESYKVAGPVFAQSLQAFLAAQCAIAGDHLWPADATEAVIKDPNYDFIVVGAGSAGAVVANRLSEVPDWKVLLIEAGGDPDLATETPQLCYNNLNTATDWGYKPEPQENACRGYKNNRCYWPRGKVLGGSSSINGMFYIRGNKLDYDEWAALGNKGWSYEDILPYFKKSENYSGEITEQIRKYHGTKGYLSVENAPNIQDMEKLILQAVGEVGLNIVSDVNGATQMGAAKASSNIKDGIRHSAARAFLSPIKDRNNLHVMKNAYVTKVVFKPNTNVVNGVVITKNGQQINVNAEKEVILSAGTINTAQLLLLSGIGPSKHLRDIGIQVKADLPVGENLQDHPFVPIFFNLKTDTTFTSLENITKEFVSYILTRKGPYSHFGPHRVVSFYNTTDTNALSPDIQFHYIIFPPGESDLTNFLGKHGIKEDILNQYQELNNGNFTLMVAVVLLQPRSKGKILLKYKDPNQYPLIYANYFKEPKDVETIIKGIKQHIFKLAECETFKSLGIKLEFLDIDECKNYEKNSDAFLECYARVMTVSLYHPTGTAKMGPLQDNSAVVDPELKVRNVERLRVIDASIMPKIVRGNTNAPVIMIGEKGADLIKKAWRIAHTDL